MKSVPLIILGLLAATGASMRGEGTHVRLGLSPQRGAARIPVTTTLETASQRGGVNTLVLRTPDDRLVHLNVRAATAVATVNGGSVTTLAMRSGDRVVVQSTGALQDESLRSVVLTGVVAYAPLSISDAMTVQITPTRTVLVDVDGRTRFSDPTRSQTMPQVIADSDVVRIHGVLDTSLGEVVVSDGIQRIGPKISRSYSAN